MLRESLMRGKDHDPDFQWRGEDVTRIENLSDIAFALALSMLVAGSGTPKNFDDLNIFLFSLFPVAAGFMILLRIWHNHYTFFRRFGLNTRKLIRYNAVLIFIILFMAYPLRFTFDSLFAYCLLLFGHDDVAVRIGLNPERAGIIIAYFSAFFAICHFILALMNKNALSYKDELELTPNEIYIGRVTIISSVFSGCVAVFVGLLAYFTNLNGFAGLFLIVADLGSVLVKPFLRKPEH